MIDQNAPHEERTVTQVSQEPGERQEVTYRSSTPVATAQFRARQLVWLAAGVVDAILALDFLFKLIGSSQVGFVSFIGGMATGLSAPFRGVLATNVTAGTHLAYWPDVVGIIVYTLAAWIVVTLVGIALAPRARAQGSR